MRLVERASPERRRLTRRSTGESGARPRPRSRSIKIAGVEVGLPSLGGSVGRNRGGSIFGRHRSGSKAGDQKRSSLQPPSASQPPLASPLREEITGEGSGAPQQQTEAQQVANKAREGGGEAAERG